MIAKTVRQAARERTSLGGTDAQALEHALTVTEAERNALQTEIDSLKSKAICAACGSACLACSQQSFAEKKDAFHKKYLAVFRALAKLLGLSKGQYTLTSNKAGSTVMGEVTFHTDYVYVSTIEFAFEQGEFLYRSVASRKDYTGGMNQYAPLSWLEGDMGPALEVFRKLAKARSEEAKKRT